MFNLWCFRSGAFPTRLPLFFDAFQLHGYVSLKRRQSSQRYIFRPQGDSLSTQKKLNGDHEDSVARSDPPQPSQGSLETLSTTNTFTSPFETAATTGLRPTQGSDEAGIKILIANSRLSEPIPDARNTYNALGGLGSWVIIPDALQPPASIKAYLASKSTEEAPTITEGHSKIGQSGKFAMRNSVARDGSLLALTLDHTRYLHDGLAKSSVHGSNTFLELVEIVFTPRRSWALEKRGFQAEDVVCWGWILAADTADIAVSRMQIVANLATHASNASPASPLPYFLFTIILRSRMLNGSSLTLLVHVLLMRLQRGKASSLPDATTAMIMLVRLVRHARRVAPGQLATIADLSGTLLKVEYEANPSSVTILSRLTYNYNRLLSLLSIAPSQHPFRYVAVQQRAQLKVVRQMALMEPALPVTREGYQALAKVQLAHKKTPAERDWARTKAVSWPPWREDKLGISEDLEYPGSHSRAIDVLHRQIEAGYMQTDWDRAATVLAGWDTDKSPTIQTRALLSRAPPTWLQSLVDSWIRPESRKKLGSNEGLEVWTARIQATRTAREAWACFCAWDTVSSLNGRNQSPYLAMFEKLAARLQTTDPGLEQLPGDGKEVHPQPISPRDYLYVPVELPSFHDFYDKMRLDGVRPGGRLLALLLDHARTLTEGSKYLEQSSYTDIKKDMMLKAHKYHTKVIRSTLNFVQPVVLASFLTMLWRTRRDSGKTWYRPASHAAKDSSETSDTVSPEKVSAHAYVLGLVFHIRLSAQIGNKILGTLARDLKTTTDVKSTTTGWDALLTILEAMDASGTETDMATFYTVVSAVENISITHPGYRFRLYHARREHGFGNGRELAKRLFIQAVVDSTSDVLVCSPEASTSIQSRFQIRPGSKRTYLERLTVDDEAMRTRWLPYSADSAILETPSPAALHLLMRLLSIGRETGSILRLLRWMDRFTAELVSVRNQIGNGDRQMRFALCVAAMAIEEEEGAGAGPSELAEEIASVRSLIEDNVALGGWPTDDELEMYLLKGRPSVRHRLQTDN